MPSVAWKLARAASRAAASSRAAAAAAAASRGSAVVQVNPRRIYMDFTFARWSIPLSVRSNPRVSQIDMDLPVITAPPSTRSSKFNDEEAYLPFEEAYRFFSSKRSGPCKPHTLPLYRY